MIKYDYIYFYVYITHCLFVAEVSLDVYTPLSSLSHKHSSYSSTNMQGFPMMNTCNHAQSSCGLHTFPIYRQQKALVVIAVIKRRCFDVYYQILLYSFSKEHVYSTHWA